MMLAMELTPVRFLLTFLLLSSSGYILFTCISRLVAWVLSRIIGASVALRVGGLNKLKEITMNFQKGPIAYVSISELKLRIRNPETVGWKILSRSSKMHLVISDVEVVLRKPKPTMRKKHSRSQKHRSVGRGTWVVFMNVAKHFSISMNEIVVRLIEMGKASLEVREIELNGFTEATATSTLGFEILLTLVSLYAGEDSRMKDGCCTPRFRQKLLSAGCETEVDEGEVLNLDHLALTGKLDHDREVGIVLQQLEITCGEAAINLSELKLQNLAVSRATEKNGIVKVAPLSAQPEPSTSLLVKKIPESAQFSLPRLQMRFFHEGKRICADNEIRGIFMRCNRTRPTEESLDAVSLLDIQMDLGEVHVLQARNASFLQIMKVAAAVNIRLPEQLNKSLRAEVDVKLGGTQFNLLANKMEKWLQLAFLKPRKEVTSVSKAPKQSNISGNIIWSCSISAPEMSVVAYSYNGMPLMNIFFHTSHCHVNSMPDKGTGVHTELAEVYFMAVEEKRSCVESLIGVDNSPGCIMHVSRVVLDMGKDLEKPEVAEGTPTVIVEAGDTEIYVDFRIMKPIVSTLVEIQSSLKRLTRRSGSSVIPVKKKAGIFVFQTEKLYIEYCGNMHIEDTTISDPKLVNYGSQGGVVIMKYGQDASLRTASIHSLNDQVAGIRQRLSINLIHTVFRFDRGSGTSVITLEEGNILYEEFDANDNPLVAEAIVRLRNLKAIRKPAKVGKQELLQDYLSAGNVHIRWDPEIHLFLLELWLRSKELIQIARDGMKGASNSTAAKVAKTRGACAVDIEEMSISAEAADGVEATLYVQSLFSEDIGIGILLENVEAAFNKCTIFRSERLQVARFPSQDQNLVLRPDLWDILIHAAGTRIIMPYRLPLRAIDDAVEDMWRGLKLAMTAKKLSLFPETQQQRDSKRQQKESKPRSKLGIYSINFHIRDIAAEIEEEPFQGWLDEHYLILKNLIGERFVRESILEESLSKRIQPERDAFTTTEAWEKLQEQTFQDYKRACEKLVLCKGSGACSSGFQAGFRTSEKRSTLMSLTLSSLDVCLLDINGGTDGMIAHIRKLDSVKPGYEVPFAKAFGKHAIISFGMLALNLRDYSIPMLSASAGRCEGDIIFAQQASVFPDQVVQEVCIGRWRKVKVFRSLSGCTPPFKFYSSLPIELDSGRFCYGVGYEPAFGDVSYAFTVALKKYDLSVRNPGKNIRPLKKEKSLPWWDDMRYYIHGINSITSTDFEWVFLASTDPYEKQDMMRMTASKMQIKHTEGNLSFNGKDFDMYLSSLQSTSGYSNKKQKLFIHAPVFKLDIDIRWECSSGVPLCHYLHAFPLEEVPRCQLYDPFRSTSLSLIWSFTLLASSQEEPQTVKGSKAQNKFRKRKVDQDVPVMDLANFDLIWIFKWWRLYFTPPHKIRSFSKWPRFGVARLQKSGNLSLDKVLTEFILRVDATPACIKHVSVADDDPAKGLTFSMQKLRYELCYSRGQEEFTFDSERELLDLVYHGLDIHLLRARLKTESEHDDSGDFIKRSDKVKQLMGVREVDASQEVSAEPAKSKDDGFVLTTDCFSVRRQSPKADPCRLSSWREHVQLGSATAYSYSSDGSSISASSAAADSEGSDDDDDDGFSAVLADNCLRVSLYSLKLLWTVNNRDAVWSWVADISKAFHVPKPSPSRQYAQRKLIEEKQKSVVADKQQQQQATEKIGSSSSSAPHGAVNALGVKDEEEGTLQFMVNVIQPQFNLQSEDAHGRFLLSAASGRVLARSFHSIIYLGFEVIDRGLAAAVVPLEGVPEISWKRRELSVILENVQAHVAPTDVDPDAGIQWLPSFSKGAPSAKRTSALLEPVFSPCTMYFQYTRHKGATTDCKVKPLKELSFNSPNITATMTSRQFHIMVDVLSNLLFARLPKPRRKKEDEDAEEDIDEVVPDGVEEVELARMKLEQAERLVNLISRDIRTLREHPNADASLNASTAGSPESSAFLFRSKLIRKLEMELTSKEKERKAAGISVRHALHKAAQQRLVEKEKGRSPSAAMGIGWTIDKVVWRLLYEGHPFAEAEINSLKLNVDRDFSDIGNARFTLKSFDVKDWTAESKSHMVLCPWNPPDEWGRNVMLRVNARQGLPREGLSFLELFQVDIYPLKIYLTEKMYAMMYDYFFPEDEQDPQKRQEVWKGSEGTKRGSRKGTYQPEATLKSTQSTAPPDATSVRPDSSVDLAVAPKRRLNLTAEHRRSSSFDQTLIQECNEIAESSSSNSSSLMRSSTVPDMDISDITTTDKSKELLSQRRSKKDSRNRKSFLEIHITKISQVELLLTYEGSKISVAKMRLLMDSFTRNEFTGSWRRLFSRVKKHIIWSVLKSVTGMQGKKFKDKMQAQANDSDSNNSSDSCTSEMRRDKFALLPFQRGRDRAGEGFVSSIKNLFNSQRRKAKALVLRTMRGEDRHFQLQWSGGSTSSSDDGGGGGGGSGGDSNYSKQLSMSKARKLLRRHSKKFRSARAKGCGDEEDGEYSSSSYQDFD